MNTKSVGLSLFPQGEGNGSLAGDRNGVAVSGEGEEAEPSSFSLSYPTSAGRLPPTVQNILLTSLQHRTLGSNE